MSVFKVRRLLQDLKDLKSTENKVRKADTMVDKLIDDTEGIEDKKPIRDKEKTREACRSHLNRIA